MSRPIKRARGRPKKLPPEYWDDLLSLTFKAVAQLHNPSVHRWTRRWDPKIWDPTIWGQGQSISLSEFCRRIIEAGGIEWVEWTETRDPTGRIWRNKRPITKIMNWRTLKNALEQAQKRARWAPTRPIKVTSALSTGSANVPTFKSLTLSPTVTLRAGANVADKIKRKTDFIFEPKLHKK